MNCWRVMYNTATDNLELVYGPKWALEMGAVRNGERLTYVGVFE